MTPKIQNIEKILIVLKKYDVEITSADLAEYCNINVKNIGRYLDKLVEKKYISRKTIQDGKKRYIHNKILARGKNKKLEHTYDDLLKQLATDDMKEAVEMNQKPIQVITDMEKKKAERFTEAIINQELAFVGNETIKSEILMIIKTIAIRTQDAHKHGFKTHEQLTKHLIELILKL